MLYHFNLEFNTSMSFPLEELAVLLKLLAEALV
jgi:hypothetical protein